MTCKYFVLFLTMVNFLNGQNYISYFTGSKNDAIKYPQGGVCIMGGAAEDDEAMKWFLRRADGGDILVLRASGSDGYNEYLFASLGISVNSVETIVCKNASASEEEYLHKRINQAEAIWFAGGDQWDYVSYWRNTTIDSLINHAIINRKIVIGGTSAGMAILGSFYFSAQYGTVTSEEALSNPYDTKVSVHNVPFIKTPYLYNLITDTHFDNRNRKGRLVTFLARIYKDHGVFCKAIACDENTAVCIDTNGLARVYSNLQSNFENAYFVQVNCELDQKSPEYCTSGYPLSWNFDGKALKVYRVKGTPNGNHTFDLKNWKNGTGGTWLDWSVDASTLLEKNGNFLECSSLALEEADGNNVFKIYPNPTSDKLSISSVLGDLLTYQYNLFSAIGHRVALQKLNASNQTIDIDLKHLEKGTYYLVIAKNDQEIYKQVIIKN